MATLQKFKHMATQCAVMGAGSPARNPTTSPIILRNRRRRRKTLRMFLGRLPSDRRCRSPERPPSLPPNDGAAVNTENITSGDSGDSRGVARVRHKLKDLLVSTSFDEEAGVEDVNEGQRAEVRATLLGSGSVGGSVGGGMRRLRCRLMRSSWRPVLVAIPE